MGDDLLARAGGDRELAARWAAERAADRAAYEIAKTIDRGTGIHTRDNVLPSQRRRGVYGYTGPALCGLCWARKPNILRPYFTMMSTRGGYRCEIGWPRRKVYDTETGNPGPFWVEWYDRSPWPLGVSYVFHRVTVHPVIPECLCTSPYP